MKLSTMAMLTAALATTACHFRRNTDADQAAAATPTPGMPLSPSAGEDVLCAAITGESPAGVQAMEVPLIQRIGTRFDRRRADYLSKTGDYAHGGTEMLAGHCWTRGAFHNDRTDPISFAAEWRCPVALVSDVADHPGQLVVDDVVASACEFDAPAGTPPRTAVSARMHRMPG